jgi:hypothetical protein
MKNKAKLLKNLKKLSMIVNSNIKALDELIQANKNANNSLATLAKDKFKFIALRNDINNLNNDLDNFEQLDNPEQKKISTKLKKIQTNISSITTDSDKKLEIALPKLKKSEEQAISPSLITAASALREAMKDLNKSIIDIKKIDLTSTFSGEHSKELIKYNKQRFSGKHLISPETEFHDLQPAEKKSWQPHTPAEFFTPTPLETIAIDIPAANPVSHTITSRNAATPTKHENTKWTDIRLKTMNSKWEKEGWENKKIPSAKTRKPMSDEEIDALVISVSIRKLNNLQNTDASKDKYANRQETAAKQALDAKLHLYAIDKVWSSAKNLGENILTIYQHDKPIFEVRPGENKIQFLIPDTDVTAEHRVAALEMFQQMCRIKGSPQEVKINCGDPAMKDKFTKNAALAGITAVSEFKNRPNL